MLINNINNFIKNERLIPIVGYEIYHPLNKSKLDLNYCKNILMELNIPVSIDENQLYKYDPNSGYYTDKCYSYTTENGTDILLSDRQKEFTDNNLSLCQDMCNYTGYIQKNKQSSCVCEIKNKNDFISDLIDDSNKLSTPNDFDSESNSKSSSSTNLIVMKCTKTLFSKEGLKNNISSYILIFIIFFYLLSLCIFIKCGFYFLKNDINDILKKKEKSEKEEEKKENKKNIIKTKIKSSNKKKNKSAIKNDSSKKNQSSIISSSLNNIRNIKQIIITGNNNHEISKKNTKNKSKKSKNNKKNKKQKNNTAQNISNIYEKNNLEYNIALLLEKRNCLEYYGQLIKIKQPIIFAFCPIKDYNSMIIKMDLFFLNFSINYAINFAFFNERIIHKIFEDGGKYDFKYFLTQISLSSVFTHVSGIILKIIFLSERNILKVKQSKTCNSANSKANSVERTLIIKYSILKSK